MAQGLRGQWWSRAAGLGRVVALVDEPDPLARPDGADMSQPIECRYYGRDFSAEEMAVAARAHRRAAPLNRFAYVEMPAHRLQARRRAQGHRVTMLAMHKDGLIVLPPPKWGRNPAVPMTFGPDTDAPLEPPPETLDEVRPIRLRTVLGGTPQSKQWNAFIARYHYLGYKTLVGAQMRYTVHDRHGQLLALLGFPPRHANWRRATASSWTPTLREKNLPKIIDNARFLILPWIRIPNLASHILSVVCRQLIADWTARYHIAPLLIETFVETPRFTGVTYRPPDGPMSASPRDADGTTGTRNTTSRKKPSGFTGNGRSLANPDQVSCSPLPCTRRNGENRHPTPAIQFLS